MNIFGHSPSISANTFNTFSEIQKTVLSKRDRLSVIGMGVAKIKPASLFFYSKYGMEVDNIQFYNKKTIKKIWSKFDVIVTANPDLLDIKPKNKISIKINTDYNQNYILIVKFYQYIFIIVTYHNRRNNYLTQLHNLGLTQLMEMVLLIFRYQEYSILNHHTED